MQLDTLFNPRSVAVIGASNDPTKVGYALMKNIMDGGTREVYPVTLSEPQVLGRAASTSISMVQGDVDLAIIAVRADVVATVLKECADKGVKNAVVISAGFKEVGDAGKKLEEDIATVAREYGITLLGPNCLGVMNAQADWNASFAVSKPKPGNVAFVSQSGALGTALLDWANREGVGFSKFVSLGNEASLTELDFLEYLTVDPDTAAVLLYVEEVRDGARFIELATRLAEKKPLVVLRAGTSKRGSAAVTSHTGSLAPSDAIFGAALRKAGAIPVTSLRTFFSLAKLFQLGYTEPLQRLVILTNGGGPSVNTADLIEHSASLSLANLADDTQAALRAVLPPMAAVKNPIDVIGDAGADRYDNSLATLVNLSDVDAVIALITPQMMTDPVKIAEALLKHRDAKPIIPVFMGGSTVAAGAALLRQEGMVSFDSPTDVVDALDALARGKDKVEEEQTDANVEALPLPELEMFGFEEMRTMLDDYDVHLEGVYVSTEDEIEDALKKLGDGPYAMKAVSRQLVHKSDLNAVQTNLVDADAVRGAWKDIMKRVGKHTEDAVVDGMLIQRMEAGVECIIGVKRDPIFGPVVVFGLGGIYVEILKDASMRMAPVSKDEALSQIREIRGFPLLSGARGQEPADIAALAITISSLSHLVLDYPDVEEIDLNPVFATPKGVAVVDARIMRKPRIPPADKPKEE